MKLLEHSVYRARQMLGVLSRTPNSSNIFHIRKRLYSPILSLVMSHINFKIKNIVTALRDVITKWCGLGIQLDLPEHILKLVGSSQYVEDRLRMMVSKWIDYDPEVFEVTKEWWWSISTSFGLHVSNCIEKVQIAQQFSLKGT